VRNRLVSREAARLIYGAAIDDELAVDAIATAALRQNLVAQRSKGAASA
jgi:hypothetical protein